MRYLLLLVLAFGLTCSLHYTRAKDTDPYFAAGTEPAQERLPLDLLRIDRSEYARGVFQESEALAGLSASGYAVNNPASGLMLRTESAINTIAEQSLVMRCLPLATLLIFPIIQPRSFEARYTLLDKRTGEVLKVYRRSAKDTEIVGWITIFGIVPALLAESVYGGEHRLEELSMQSVLSEVQHDLKQDSVLRARVLDAAKAEIPPAEVHIYSIRDEQGRDVSSLFMPDLTRALRAKNIEPAKSGSKIVVSLSEPFTVGSGGSHQRTQIVAAILSPGGEKRAVTFQVTFARQEIAEKLANVIRTLLYDTEIRESKPVQL